MTHYTLEQWTDYVRGLVEEPVAGAMAEHARGCPACEEHRRGLAAVARTLVWDAHHEVPVETLARAHRLAARLPRRERATLRALVASLVFDSGIQPLAVGVRTSGSGLRQMVFEAESYQLHLQWDQDPRRGPMALVGRISAPSRPVRVAGLVVRAMAAGALAQETTTNDFGEFVLECRWSPSLALHVPLAEVGVEIEVPLARVLGRPRPPASRRRSMN